MPAMHIDTTSATGRLNVKIPRKKFRPAKAAISKTSSPKKTSAGRPTADLLSLKSDSEDVMVCRLRRLSDLPTKDQAGGSTPYSFDGAREPNSLLICVICVICGSFFGLRA